MRMKITQSGNSTDVTGNKMEESESGEIREWLHLESIPASWTISGGIYHKQIRIEGPKEGSLRAEGAGFDNFLISQLSVACNERVSCTCEGRGTAISLYFNLAGSCSLNHVGQDLLTTAGEHNIYHSTDFEAEMGMVPEAGRVETLEINLPTPYYARLLSGYSALQDTFLRCVAGGMEGHLQEGMMPITMPMKWIINTIRQNRRTGILKRLFLEAKILELLMLQVEQAEIRKGESGVQTTRTSEREALYEARAILEKSLVDPPTIKDLARMVGLNEFSLKKGFRETFHETIFGFVSKVKMQQAREMLLEGNKTVNEVSMLAGYKNPQHFTAAFRKHFGVPPSKLK